MWEQVYKTLLSFPLSVDAFLIAQSALYVSCITSNLNSPSTNSILACKYSTAPSSTSQKTSVPHIVLVNSHPSRIIGLLSTPVLIVVRLSPYLFLLCVSVSLCSLLRMPQQGRSTFAAPATVCSSAKSLPRGSPVPGHIGEKFFPSMCVRAYVSVHTTLRLQEHCVCVKEKWSRGNKVQWEQQSLN